MTQIEDTPVHGYEGASRRSLLNPTFIAETRELIEARPSSRSEWLEIGVQQRQALPQVLDAYEEAVRERDELLAICDEALGLYQTTHIHAHLRTRVAAFLASQKEG